MPDSFQNVELHLVCNNCDSKEPAKARCFDCGKYMCNTCVDVHKITAFANPHRLKNLNGIADSVVVEKFWRERYFTPIDKKQQESFSANVVEREKHRDQLQSEIIYAQNRRQAIESALNNIKDMQERVETNSKDIERMIDATIDGKIQEFTQSLEETRTSLKNELEDTKALKMKKLSSQEDGLLKHSAELKSAIAFTEKFLNNANRSEVAMGELSSSISKVIEKDIDSEVDEEDRVKLHVKEKPPIIPKDFLRLEDASVPDPNQCYISIPKTHGTNIALAVRNSDGCPIHIKKSRITVECDFDTSVVDLRGTEDCGANLNYGIVGVFISSKTSNYNAVNCQYGKLEVFIDGQPIRASPFNVWSY